MLSWLKRLCTTHSFFAKNRDSGLFNFDFKIDFRITFYRTLKGINYFSSFLVFGQVDLGRASEFSHDEFITLIVFLNDLKILRLIYKTLANFFGF